MKLFKAFQAWRATFSAPPETTYVTRCHVMQTIKVPPESYHRFSSESFFPGQCIAVSLGLRTIDGSPGYGCSIIKVMNGNEWAFDTLCAVPVTDGEVVEIDFELKVGWAISIEVANKSDRIMFVTPKLFYKKKVENCHD